MRFRPTYSFLILCAGAAALLACGKKEQATEQTGSDGGVTGGKKIRVAYVTNGIDPFWVVAEAGAKAGAKEFNVDCEVLMPPKGIGDQKRMVENLLVNGIDGIAISPIDAANQVGFIDEAAAKTNVITQDSDAPESKRLCFVGMDNYKAGRQAGQLVKEILPDGGTIMIFVGRLEQLNAQQRRQGVIDELLDRPMATLDNLTIDPPGAALKGAKYEILGTRTDNFDYAKAKSNAEDTIASSPNLNCMVGLFAYNIPACLTAVREAGKLGQIKLVSFDEASDTLQGITDGHVHGTVSQQPYKYGFESVRILAGLARGDKSVLPEGGFLEINTVVVRKDNVESFWAELKRLQGTE
jgi:ribose transport system substrate-binding protein